MERVGLWVNQSKSESQNWALKLTHWFHGRGWEVYTEWEQIKTKKIQFMISLGGDGTLLEAAREAAAYQIPVLGVNLGRLGFLCEIERDEVYQALEKVLRHEYSIQERMMLSAALRSAGDDKETIQVLNDVVFMRDAEGTIRLQANLSGEPSVSYPADGLIVATPTGSTAYSLSAGGPVICPDVKAIVLTPLAAHSLSARPMVVAHDENIEILLASGGECNVVFDGRYQIKLKPGETVRISAASISAKLIRLGKRSFPRVLREKLRDRWHD